MSTIIIITPKPGSTGQLQSVEFSSVAEATEYLAALPQPDDAIDSDPVGA